MNSFPQLHESHEWLNAAQLSESLSEPLPTRLAVAWSGGADSTALLLALKSCAYEVHAWHVDHGWHPDSAKQAEQLAQQADAWGVPFSSVRLEQSPNRNREALARSGRYEAFQLMAEQSDLTCLCLAHHRNDQAETVYMRMLQGAGVHGLCGMQPVRMRGQLKLFRPFLHRSRSELIEALRRAGVNWLEDASNSDTTLWRNHLRRNSFPAMTANGVDPVSLFLRWQRQAAVVVDRIERALADVDIDCSQACCSLEWQVWEALSPTVRAYLLQRMMQMLFGEGVVAGRRHIELMSIWMEQGGRGGLDLSRSRLMRKDRQLLLMRKA
jgi:tRNA(Ile)-lysidine synthase